MSRQHIAEVITPQRLIGAALLLTALGIGKLAMHDNETAQAHALVRDVSHTAAAMCGDLPEQSTGLSPAVCLDRATDQLTVPYDSGLNHQAIGEGTAAFSVAGVGMVLAVRRRDLEATASVEE